MQPPIFMRSRSIVLAFLLLAALTPACATTATWEEPAPAGWAMYGRVESIRQYVRETHGDPAAGAVAGAAIGSLLGTALGGHGFGTILGAAEGAMIGANASQGHGVDYTFDVYVRFDDGSLRRFVFENYLPFRQGETVVWTPRGLARP
jgi:outer membrane lipoprotein SlyB